MTKEILHRIKIDFKIEVCHSILWRRLPNNHEYGNFCNFMAMTLKLAQPFLTLINKNLAEAFLKKVKIEFKRKVCIPLFVATTAN